MKKIITPEYLHSLFEENPEVFKELHTRAGFTSQRQAASFIGLGKSVYNSYMSGRQLMPVFIYRLLCLMAERADLAALLEIKEDEIEEKLARAITNIIEGREQDIDIQDCVAHLEACAEARNSLATSRTIR